jgi:hypothetical protein
MPVRRTWPSKSIGFGESSREDDAGTEAVKKHLHPRIPQPSRCDRAVRLSGQGPKLWQPGRGQVHPPARTAAGGPERPHPARRAKPRRLAHGDRGYDKLYGARPMSRLIQEKIKQPLAEELLFGKLAPWRRSVGEAQGQCPGLRDHACSAQAQEGQEDRGCQGDQVSLSARNHAGREVTPGPLCFGFPLRPVLLLQARIRDLLRGADAP